MASSAVWVNGTPEVVLHDGSTSCRLWVFGGLPTLSQDKFSMLMDAMVKKDWIIGVHIPSGTMLMELPEPRTKRATTELMNNWVKLTIKTTVKLELVAFDRFIAEQWGILSTYAHPKRPETETQKDDASTIALPRASDATVANLVALCPSGVAPIETLELFKQDLTLTTYESGVFDKLWTNDELLELTVVIPKDPHKFVWFPEKPKTLSIYFQHGDERRVTWIQWRAEVSGVPLEKVIEDFPRFLGYYRDVGNFKGPHADKTCLAQAKLAWRIFTGEPFPKDVSPDIQVLIKNREAVQCKVCSRPMKAAGSACSESCRQFLCRHCDSQLEEKVGVQDYLLTKHRQRITTLIRLQERLRLRPAVEEYMLGDFAVCHVSDGPGIEAFYAKFIERSPRGARQYKIAELAAQVHHGHVCWDNLAAMCKRLEDLQKRPKKRDISLVCTKDECRVKRQELAVEAARSMPDFFEETVFPHRF